MNKDQKLGKSAFYYQGSYWSQFVTRNMSFWHSCLDRAGWQMNAQDYLVPKKHTFSVTIDSGKLTTVFNSDRLNKTHDRAIGQLCRSKRFFTVVKIIQRNGTSLLAASRKLVRHENEYNYRHFIQTYQAMCPSLSLITSIGRAGHDILRQEIRRAFTGITKSNIDQTASLLSYPDHHTPMVRCQMSLLRMGAYIQKEKIRLWAARPDVQKKILQHHRQFSFLPVNFNEQPWTLSDVRMHLRVALQKNCQNEIDNILKVHKNRVKDRNALLKGRANPRLRSIAKAMQIATDINEYRKQVFCRASLAYRPLFMKIAKRHSLSSWQTLYMLTPDEFGRLAYHHEKSILSILPRKEIGVISDPKNPLHYRIMEKEIVRRCVIGMRSKPIKSLHIKRSVVRGFSANNGLVAGLVKIVLKRSDFKKFNHNDILISAMTSVDFIPIMEKAAAFVTDEGGITSHASIVSRELNKPCVIGTKIATKVFRDGDRVEVDAYKGVVRKIDG